MSYASEYLGGVDSADLKTWIATPLKKIMIAFLIFWKFYIDIGEKQINREKFNSRSSFNSVIKNAHEKIHAKISDTITDSFLNDYWNIWYLIAYSFFDKLITSFEL